jgi:tryptophan halogenase
VQADLAVDNPPRRKTIIVGGGTAGWMAAALIAVTTKGRLGTIELVESEQIGTIGVGEATIPYILDFNRLLGINEADFIRHTKATFKLGIEFVNWAHLGHRYMHPFGQIGAPIERVAFQHFLTRRALRQQAEDFETYSLCCRAAQLNRFSPPPLGDRGVLSTLGYAYHFDAGLYAAYLRRYAEGLGVRRHEGRIVQVMQRPADGFIQALRLEDGSEICGDLFLDCSGLGGLLIEKTLKSGFDDWSAWLPCNSAAFVPSQSTHPLLPYTRSTAHTAGWQWRIPLQHRIGNGHVYSAPFMSDNEATDTLLKHLDTGALAEPKFVRFTTGRRRKFWIKNVVAIGLSGGFLEPLESTSIHLIHSGLIKLLNLWPDANFDPLVSEQYNQAVSAEYEAIRDFIILHYKATERDDSEFWRYCRHMPVPDSLNYKMDHFRTSGRIVLTHGDLFQAPSWLAVMLGQNITPTGYDPMANIVDDATADRQLYAMKTAIQHAAQNMPDHRDYLTKLMDGGFRR